MRGFLLVLDHRFPASEVLDDVAVVDSEPLKLVKTAACDSP